MRYIIGIWGTVAGPQTTSFCPIHCVPNSILRPYYTAVHIPAEKKKAEYTMWHLAEIVEADKHREPTEYELSLDNHSYYD